MLRLFVLAQLALLARSAPLPSCDEETEAHCVGEDADLSPEGINKCLAALDSKSDRCTSLLALTEACTAELSDGGVCFAAKMDGEAMPCLVQRTAPESLSEACRNALPVDDLKGLAKMWKEGKRQLTINEIADLNADDKDTYNRWQKKKKGKKSDSQKERDYAVKVAKKERVQSLMTTAVKEGKPSSVAEAIEIASKEMKKAVDEDMTGTFKAFTKVQLETIARDAYKATKKEEL